MATEAYSQPSLVAGARMDVRRFQTVLLVVSGMANGEVITPSASGSKGGAMVPYAGVKETDLSVTTTITANGAYSLDAFAEFSWSSSLGVGSTAVVDVIAKG